MFDLNFVKFFRVFFVQWNTEVMRRLFCVCGNVAVLALVSSKCFLLQVRQSEKLVD